VTATALPSRWRASPARLARLAAGLWVFGTGEGLIVNAALGNSPWTVFAQGLAKQIGTTVGVATIISSGLVLLCWVPLRQRPGLGTIANAIVIGIAIDATLDWVPGGGVWPVRALEVLGGIGLVALGSGLYLGAALGPGPRDGLMTGLHRRTGRAIALIRACIECSALLAGWILGGTVGIGTVAFALLIGPGVATSLRLLGVARPKDL
jgi:uncharacterized membrane protein YczE